ncbi:MAG: pseudaminic acid synthase [Bdellovibrionales bacterium]
MLREIQIGPHKVGPGHKPFIIAEMSGNHNQSLATAMKIVESAALTGVQALKLQTYTADTMTIDMSDSDFSITDEKSLWKGENLYNLYKKAHTPWDWHKPIMDRCRELGMLCFSTPFDDSAVDFLEELNVPCYKVASFENTHLPLIDKIAKTGKPIIVSTGMATLSVLEDVVRTVKNAGNDQLILLKCTSTYPASPKDTNILTIPHMSKMFNVQVGLSDHTMGVGVSLAAVAVGATVIEKHFTLARADGGVDSTFSMEPAEMKLLVQESEKAWLSLGEINYQPTVSEEKSLQFRRSIYVIKNIKSGEKFTGENVKIIRPGYGLEPKHITQVLTARASRDLVRGHALRFEDMGS